MPLPQDAAPDALPALARGNGDLAAYRGKAVGCGPTGSRRPLPSVPVEQRRLQEGKEGVGRSGAEVWSRPAGCTFMCPRRGGAAAVTLGPPGSGQRPGSASAFLPRRPRRSGRAGPPPALPAGDAPTAARTAPRPGCAGPSPGAGAALAPPAVGWCPGTVGIPRPSK